MMLKSVMNGTLRLQCRRLSSHRNNSSSRSRSRSRHPYFNIHEEFEKTLAFPGILAPFQYVAKLWVSARSESEGGEGGGDGDHEKKLSAHVGSRQVLRELRHPLLLKYHFDPLDFIAGCRLAHTQILACLYAKDLRHHLGGYVSQGPSRAFLEEVCSPEALESFLDHADRGHGGEGGSDRAGKHDYNAI